MVKIEIGEPFPEKLNRADRDIEFVSEGKFDIMLKGKKVKLKGFSNEDILQLRHMLLDEIKRQNEENG